MRTWLPAWNQQMCYHCGGQTLNEREQAHRTAAVGEANQTSSPRQSLSPLEMPIRETCTVNMFNSAILPSIVGFRLTCCATSHKVLYCLIVYSRQTRIEPLESMYSLQAKIPRVLHFSLTFRDCLHIASWLSTTHEPIIPLKRLASKDTTAAEVRY